MGATTAFFSVLYGVVLRPPDYPGAEPARQPRERRPETVGNGDRLLASRGRRRRGRFSGRCRQIGAAGLGRQTLTAAGDSDGFAERVKVSGVTPEVFRVLGVEGGTRPHVHDGRRRRRPSRGHHQRQALAGPLRARRPTSSVRTVRLNGRRVSRSSASCRPASPSRGRDDGVARAALAAARRSDRSNRYLVHGGAPRRRRRPATQAQRGPARVARELRHERSRPTIPIRNLDARRRVAARPPFRRPAAAADGAARRRRDPCCSSPA